jgi:predicted DsbA family dithiol-disulfide isomerase
MQPSISKYGRTADESKKVREHIKVTADSLGFPFGEGGARRLVNTFAAHKLLTKAGRHQTALKLALFAAYFQQGKDVSDTDTLLDIAESVGLNGIDCANWLSDDALSQQVRGEQAYWRDENISGVPAIIFDGKYMVPGAQSAETFAQLIGKVLAKR